MRYNLDMEPETPPQIPPTSIRLTPSLEKDIEAAMATTELSKPDVIRQALRLGIAQLVIALKSPTPPETEQTAA